MELLPDGPCDLDELRSLRERIPALVHFGTSSWNYEGWQGLVYHRKYPKSGAVTKMFRKTVRPCQIRQVRTPTRPDSDKQ